MLEIGLFSLLKRTADAGYPVTDEGTICSRNGAAERLFGYSASGVLHRNIDEVLDARDALGTPSFDLEVRTRSQGRIWVTVSTDTGDLRRSRRDRGIDLSRTQDPDASDTLYAAFNTSWRDLLDCIAGKSVMLEQSAGALAGRP
ncbi:MAG: PAS domain S-box protein [Gemmatimonadota bacterium]